MANKNKGMSEVKFILAVLTWIMITFKRSPKTGLFIFIVVTTGYAIYFVISRVVKGNIKEIVPSGKNTINSNIIMDFVNEKTEKSDMKIEDYGHIPEVQKRLDNLKDLYHNGFMEKEEYNERCKKIMESNM